MRYKIIFDDQFYFYFLYSLYILRHRWMLLSSRQNRFCIPCSKGKRERLSCRYVVKIETDVRARGERRKLGLVYLFPLSLSQATNDRGIVFQ